MHVQSQKVYHTQDMQVCAARQQAQLSRTNTKSQRTYSCGNRIREASCSDAYCFIHTGKRVDLALMQLIDAGGYFRIPRPIPTAGHGKASNDSSKKFMVFADQDLTSAVLFGVRGPEVCFSLCLEQRLIICSLQKCLAQTRCPASLALPALQDPW